MIYNVTLHKKDYPTIPYSLGIMADKLNTLIIDEITTLSN